MTQAHRSTGSHLLNELDAVVLAQLIHKLAREEERELGLTSTA